jgi:hypothetical protein
MAQWMGRGLGRAARAVGQNSIERLTWLLAAIQAGTALTRRNAEELLDECMFFALVSGHMTDEPPAADIAILDREFLTPVRSRLEDLRGGKPWVMRDSKLSVIISLKHGRKVEGPAKALFLWQASELLGEHSGALQTCWRSDCSHWFVIRKPGQKYCSPTCSQIMRNRTFQKAHPPEHHSELRRRSYLKIKARAAAAPEAG